MFLTYFFAAVSAIYAVIPTATAVINGFLKIDKGWQRHLVSWVVSVAIAIFFVATGNLTFGLPVVWNYVCGIVAGIAAGGASNGFYDWKKVQAIFDSLENTIREKTTSSIEENKE